MRKFFFILVAMSSIALSGLSREGKANVLEQNSHKTPGSASSMRIKRIDLYETKAVRRCSNLANVWSVQTSFLSDLADDRGSAWLPIADKSVDIAPNSPVDTSRVDGDSLSMRELAKLQARMKSAAPLTWVLTGDSITHGAKHLKGQRSYPELLASWLRLGPTRVKDVVINTGITGHTAGHILTDFYWRVAQFHPDVVCINVGMNDSVRGPTQRDKYELELRELIKRVRAIGAVPLISTTNTIQEDNSDAAKRTDLPAYNMTVVKVAREESVLLVDHWKHWQASGPAVVSWYNDAIHPNAAGHVEMFNEILKTIQAKVDPGIAGPNTSTTNVPVASVPTDDISTTKAALNPADELVAIKAMIADKATPMVWVFSGTDGAEKTLGGARNTAELFAERVRYEMVRLRDMVINTTTPGEDSNDWQREFEMRVSRFRPNVVVVTPAANDTAAELSALIHRVRSIGAIPILLADTSNASLIKQVADEINVLQVPNSVPPANGLTASAESEFYRAIGLFQLLDIYDAKSMICTVLRTKSRSQR